jgi:hypothetical protein
MDRCLVNGQEKTPRAAPVETPVQEEKLESRGQVFGDQQTESEAAYSTSADTRTREAACELRIES